jgi:hypothetical protein
MPVSESIKVTICRLVDEVTFFRFEKCTVAGSWARAGTMKRVEQFALLSIRRREVNYLPGRLDLDSNELPGRDFRFQNRSCVGGLLEVQFS